MFTQICDAVAACHAVNVFHRDIKPENFIVTNKWVKTPDGKHERELVVKLTDFGLSTNEVESTGIDCGTAPYISYGTFPNTYIVLFAKNSGTNRVWESHCAHVLYPCCRHMVAWNSPHQLVCFNPLFFTPIDVETPSARIYHAIPWTDSAEGVCPTFDLYRQNPTRFFMERFPEMTMPVAHFLATRVFCILGDSSDANLRVSAQEFGVWARDLPAHFSVGDRFDAISVSSMHSLPPSRRSSWQPFTSSTFIRRGTKSAPLSPLPAHGILETELPTLVDSEDGDTVHEESEEDQPNCSTQWDVKKFRREEQKNNGGVSAEQIDAKKIAEASQPLGREITRPCKGFVSAHAEEAVTANCRQIYQPISCVTDVRFTLSLSPQKSSCSLSREGAIVRRCSVQSQSVDDSTCVERTIEHVELMQTIDNRRHMW